MHHRTSSDPRRRDGTSENFEEEILGRGDERHRDVAWLGEPGTHQGPLCYPDILKGKRQNMVSHGMSGVEMSNVVPDIDLHSR